MTKTIGIIHFDMGNIGSIINALSRIGAKSKVCRLAEEVKETDGIILPGVGQFSKGMENLKRYDLEEALTGALKRGVPILGICLGFQLLSTFSEEGNVPGLGWLPTKVSRFNFPQGSRFRIPHVGWNTVDFLPGKLVKNIPSGSRFYFTHSYHVHHPLGIKNKLSWSGMTEYGSPFISMVEERNIFGTQFHPEKSHGCGLQLLKNFVEVEI